MDISLLTTEPLPLSLDRRRRVTLDSNSVPIFSMFTDKDFLFYRTELNTLIYQETSGFTNNH